MTTAISAATAASATTANSAKQLSADMNTFLTLMTTQMKNQDPLDPMKSSEYTQQLATYSQVEQAIQQTSKLDQILNQMSSQSLTSAASYVGMSVTTQQSTATLGPGGARWSYDVPASATATKARTPGRRMGAGTEDETGPAVMTNRAPKQGKYPTT